jgi:hypothetical protein
MFYFNNDKIALCFIINYEHELSKEQIWKEWIEPNKDIINIYFFYKDINKIKSEWIKKHAIPKEYILPTSYFYIVPAYFSLMNYSRLYKRNKWFCFLTDHCCPIITPQEFRNLFFENSNKSIMSWDICFWNVEYTKRANLHLLPKEYRLSNTPWFILTRNHVIVCLNFLKYSKTKRIYNLISKGGLANESIFAIIFQYNRILNTNNFINEKTHLMDWSRMPNPNSPHTFIEGSTQDIDFIQKSLEKNPYSIKQNYFKFYLGKH